MRTKFQGWESRTYHAAILFLGVVLFLVASAAFVTAEELSWDQIMANVFAAQQAQPQPLVQMPGPYQPGEGRVRYITSGDPALADLAEPGVKHVLVQGDPELAELVRSIPPPPQSRPINVQMPGPVERPVRYVQGDPALADLAEPGVIHRQAPPPNPDLAAYAQRNVPPPGPAPQTVIGPNAGGAPGPENRVQTVIGQTQSSPTRISEGPTTPTRIESGNAPNLGQGTPTTITDPTRTPTRITTPPDPTTRITEGPTTPTRIQSGGGADLGQAPPTTITDPARSPTRITQPPADVTTRITEGPTTPTRIQSGGGADLGQGTPTTITDPTRSPTRITSPAPEATTAIAPGGGTPTQIQPGNVPNLGEGTPTRISGPSAGGTRIGQPPAETVVRPGSTPNLGQGTPTVASEPSIVGGAPAPSGGGAPQRPSISDFAPQIDPSQVQMPGRVEGGTRYVRGDPALADLAQPGVKHLPATTPPPGDPDLANLVRTPAPGGGGATPPSSGGGGAPSGGGAIERPSLGQFAPQIEPSQVNMPGRVEGGTRYVRGDPALADLAEPGVKHVRIEGDPDLANLVRGGGGQPPSGGSGGGGGTPGEPAGPTRVQPGGPGAAAGEGNVTRIAEPGGGRKPGNLLDGGKSSVAPPEGQSLGESIASGVAVGTQVGGAMTREMQDAMRENRDVNVTRIVSEGTGASTYDVGRRHAEEELRRYHDGEQSKVEALGNAVVGTADEIVVDPMRNIVRQNLEEMESRAAAEGRRPTMTEGMGTYVNILGETAGHYTGVRAAMDAAFDTQGYDKQGNAIATQAELGQTIDRHLTSGSKNIEKLQGQIENLINNGDPNDPKTGQQIRDLLDQYDSEYQRMQNLQGVTERTMQGDQDRLNNVRNQVGYMVDSQTMRGYADDIYGGRGGRLPTGDEKASEPGAVPAGSNLTPEYIEDLVRRSEDKNLTQAERDQATHDLMGVIDVLRGGGKKDDGKGGEGGREGEGDDGGTPGETVDTGGGKTPPGEGETGPEVTTPGEGDDYHTGDPAEDLFEDFIVDLILSANVSDSGSKPPSTDTTRPPSSDEEGGDRGGLADAEAEAGGDVDVEQFASLPGGSPLDGFVESGSAYQDRTGEIRVNRAQQDVRQGTTAGDEDLANVSRVRDQGGLDAQQINQDTTAEVAGADREHSWGNVIGDAVTTGIIAGATTAAQTTAGLVADQVSDNVFDGSRSSTSSASTASSEDQGEQVASGPTPENTYNPNMLGSGSSGGSKPPAPPPTVSRPPAPMCPNCGIPMVWCGDGQYHCPNSAYVRSNPGTVRGPRKPPKPPKPPASSGSAASSSASSPSGPYVNTYNPNMLGPAPAPTPVRGTWVQDPYTGPNDGQVHPTGERFIPSR